MPERHLLPIPLPHGRSGQTGFVTVYFSPRLRLRGPLSDYPEWVDWPNTVNNIMSLDVLVNGVSRPFTRVTPLAESAAWSAVFDPQTPVSGHRPTDWRELARDGLQVGPGGDFSEAILELYAAFAKSYPDGPPTGDEALTVPETAVLSDPAADVARDYVAPMSAKVGERITEPRDPEWDFHEYVSLLGHHPQLLRILGIAVELQVELPAAPATIRVHTDYDDGLERRAVDFVMATTSDFWAKPNPDAELTEQEHGFLRLAAQDAFLSIVDVASSADRLRDLDKRLPGHSGTLPALRTRALTLVRPDLVAAFRNRTERQWAIEEDIDTALGSGQPVPIFAEDVAIGHRIDVFEPEDPAGVWRSLFERQTTASGYHFPNDDTLDRVPEPDEGWTTTTLVTELVETFGEPVDDRNDPFVPLATRRLDDQLYRWDGWSGAARPSGSAVDGTGGKAPEQPSEPPAGDAVQFAANYEVLPGSLPRLRFGRQYLMRARCVDLSGDSRPLTTAAPPVALPPVETFGRLEPIAGPIVVRRGPRPDPGVGDTARTIVLRSDYDVDDATVSAQERLLFPGQVGQDLCELHGQPGGGVDPASYRLLTTRDARDPDDPWIVDPVTGEPIATGRRRQLVRYLSDPFIGRLRAFHHGESAEHLATIGGAWPAVNSARVHVVAGQAPTVVNPDDVTELRVAVAKADIHTVDLSYAPADGDVESFGLWHQFDEIDHDKLRSVVERGAHWMFSARTSVQLVHAVRRPLLAPRIAPAGGDDDTPLWAIARARNSTGVVLTTTVEVDRRSTERLTLDARWIDLVDDVRAEGPEPRRGGAALGRFLTPREVDAPPSFEIVDHRAELGDTRRHAATIDLEAFSSFSAYFTEERAGRIGVEPTQIERRGFARAAVQVTTDDGRTATEGVDYAVVYPQGTVAVLPGGRLRDGQTVTIRFVPLPVSRRSNEPQIEPFEIIFPSTKAPPPPSVVEAVPAFARRRTTVGENGDSEHLVVHEGGVLRLYLARPWNVSGDGEQLAVLVARSPGDAVGASCLGRDPIITGTTTALDAGSFPNRIAVAESPDGVHDLVLHDVQFDTASKRWFTDVAVTTAMYRPFLRLVVARYQADSITGETLSSTVVLDPVRLGVTRTVSVREGTGIDSFDVAVTGPDHGGMTADDGTPRLLTNEVVVTHQRVDPGIADADLRWRVDVSSVTLPRSVDGSTGTWSGTVSAPGAGSPRRLVITESEPALVGDQIPAVGVEVIHVEVVELPVGAR